MSLHVNSGTVAAMLMALPSGLVHGTSAPPTTVRLRRAPSAIDMPPP